MKNNKLSNFEMCTLAIVGALQFAEQLRRAGRDLTRPAQKKEERPKPVMKIGKTYQLVNGNKVFCYRQNAEKEFMCVMEEIGTILWYSEDGKCIYCRGHEGLSEFNVRRTWKKKYDKQK